MSACWRRSPHAGRRSRRRSSSCTPTPSSVTRRWSALASSPVSSRTRAFGSNSERPASRPRSGPGSRVPGAAAGWVWSTSTTQFRPYGPTAPSRRCTRAATGRSPAGSAGAALALADLRDDLGGAVEVIGCPADELHAPGAVRARWRQVVDGGGWTLGPPRRGPLRPPGVHRHRFGGVALHAPPGGHGGRLAHDGRGDRGATPGRRGGPGGRRRATARTL